MEDRGFPMKLRIYFPVLLLITAGVVIMNTTSGLSGPAAVSGEINMENQWPVVPKDGEPTVLAVQGSFILNEKTGLDLFGPVAATLTVSSGQWDAEPRITTYGDVTPGEWVNFMIDITIPEDARAGENSPYTVTVRFEGQVGEDEVTGGFVVTIMSATGDDDTSGPDDDDSQGNNTVEAKGFPIWPVFLLGLIAILVVSGIWAYRNVEVVRETDGKRRIYLREKDTGRIFGKDR
jgi:hypothetical protein